MKPWLGRRGMMVLLDMLIAVRRVSRCARRSGEAAHKILVRVVCDISWVRAAIVGAVDENAHRAFSQTRGSRCGVHPASLRPLFSEGEKPWRAGCPAYPWGDSGVLFDS